MSTKQPSDWAVRLRATDPRHSFLVQAPAGSGKTELLTDRILALLATVARPEEIVAITFTRKAAAEMHERVLEKLRRAQDPSPPDTAHALKSWTLGRAALERDREFGWALLEHPARLSIRTIDAFCASLVRNMPWLSSMGGVPKLVDDARMHYLEAARLTLEMVGESAPVTRLLEHMDLDVAQTCEALADMLAQRDQWLPLLSEGDDRHVLEENFNDAVRQDLRGLRALMPVGWAQQLAPIAHAAAEVLSQSDPSHPIVALLDWDGEVFETEADALDCWKGLAALLLTSAGSLRKTVNKNQGFLPKTPHKDKLLEWLRSHESEQLAPWVVRLQSIIEMPQPVFSQEQWEILQAQLSCLRTAAAQLMLRFMEVGEVDFIEIARRADQALGRVEEPTELLLKLDANIRHLLIDEFQDTSQSQISLIEKITAGWQEGDGRTLFLVGDPMQSIYRFRKADVVLFLRVRDEGLGSVRPECLTLTDNFRSQSGIVEWVNQTFSSLFPAQDDPAAGAIAYAHSTAFKEATLTPAVRFHGVCPESGQRARDVVLTLVKEALAAFPDAEHPVAILVRARSHLKDVTQLLAQEGIACRAVELVPLHLRAYVVDLVQIIRALAHPGDRAAWLSVLRSPYCGLRLESLHVLFGMDRISTIPTLLEQALRATGPESISQAQRLLAPDEHQRLCAVAPVLLQALVEDDLLPLAARVERVWRLLGGVALARTATDLQDAESVFALIEKIAPYGGLDVDILDARLTRLFASPESGARSVEVMTMHKAKGLQFESVILFGLHHAPVADRAPLVRIEQVADKVMLGPIKARALKEQDEISKYLAQRDKRRSAFEVDRLLYVAATRAQQSLHLVAELQRDPETGEYLAARAGSLLERLSLHIKMPELPPHVQLPSTLQQNVPAFSVPRLMRLQHRKPRQFESTHAQDSIQTRMSYTWRAQANDERLIGVLVHGWLAHIGEQGAASWSPERLEKQRDRIARQFMQMGLVGQTCKDATQEVFDTLVAMLESDRGRWLLNQAQARREWALLDDSGQISVLDYAIRDETGWLVVDFKTSRPAADESAEAFGQRMMSRYRPQLERYCEKLRAFDGAAARAALYFPRDQLWFEYVPVV
ncbi:UvrD-helicase domain-containing protein [Zwartia vadi]|uniref:UvrD-helicase domain-containing protein n=1 Tax=Zwartia vadi TaxID=3058168 RepID=UPI0025B2CA2C|nr:UvrD-helicase domain-containing protein [Zwartia vadi]MDN3986854.1 UvrD-helicase domain-containing protein [Zwartia vadi]